MDNWTKTRIYNSARETGIELTETRWRVLAYAWRFYRKNGVGPLYQNMKKNTGLTRIDIDALFPQGLNSIYTWVGIPVHSPDTGCKPVVTVKVDVPRRVYLDYNASAPIRPEVKRLLFEFLGDNLSFGNPSSSTDLGKMAYQTIDVARERIATAINVHPSEIFFTACGTESNNWAIKGIALRNFGKKGHLITTKVEHPSVLKSMAYLESIGYLVTYLDVTPDGSVKPSDVQDAIRPDTQLVSTIAVSNEVGTLNPLEEIGELLAKTGIPFMSDGVQAFCKVPIRPKSAGIKLMSMSGHKICAPKGVGALFIDKSVDLPSYLHGGEQEMGKRSGTENVASIAAFGLATELARYEMEHEGARLARLRTHLLKGLREMESNLVVHGSMENRAPNNLNVGFPGVDGQSLVLSLNAIGIYVSSGSACSAGKSEASHVLRAMGVDTESNGAIRFSMGIKTVREDIDYLLKYLPGILGKLRE